MKRTLAALTLATAMGWTAAGAEPDAAIGVRAPFEGLRLSAELARRGHERHDPWALAIAARIRRQTPLHEVARAPEGQASAGLPTVDVSEAWLSEAEALGAEDPRLVGLVRDIRAAGFKGRAGGPQVSRARIGPGGLHRYGEMFESGRPAVVYVEGDGDTDLMLVVRGPAGETACAQPGPGDVKLCAWTAARAGRYAVEVVNRGRVDNAYALATN